VGSFVTSAALGGQLSCSETSGAPSRADPAEGIADAGAPDDAGLETDALPETGPAVDTGVPTLDLDGTMTDAGSDEADCSEVLVAVVRDFRGWDGTAGPRHADFEGEFTGSRGIVAEMLGADSKPVYAPAGATPATTGAAEFDQWYRDVTDLNQRFEVELPLSEDPTRPGVYVFDDQEFFPVDGMGWGDGFGNNFHFTTEIHLEFPYQGGETFTFQGDDDLFLFVNGHLAIDLGGVHPAETDTVDLDARAADLGIERGQTYRMDIFHAERHTTFSTFRIETTLRCITPVVIR
jgi:fibro-slime domain-containing protein